MKLTLKALGAFVVLVLATFGLASVAGAQSYTGATLTANNLTVAPGGSMTVEGRGFLPNASVSVTVASTPTEVGPTQTDGEGNFSITFAAPTEVGAHTVTATDGVNTLVINFEVAAAGSGAPVASGNLPYTGNDSSLPLAQIVAGLLAAGAVVYLTVRKRQHSAVKVDA